MLHELVNDLQPKAKIALGFFLLAKLSCFTFVPLFLVLARVNKIPSSLDWLGLGIYGTAIFLSLFFILWQVAINNKGNVPPRSEVIKWMRHYDMDLKHEAVSNSQARRSKS